MSAATTSRRATVVPLALAIACALPASSGNDAHADAGRAAPAAAAVAQASAEERKIVRPVFADGAVAEGWTDIGWAPRTLAPHQPARLDLSAFGGWILTHDPLKTDKLGGLLVRVRAPASFGDFLEVSLDSRRHRGFPRVRPSPATVTTGKDGWTEIWLTMETLDPLDEPFDRLQLRAVRSVGTEPVEVSFIGFTAGAPASKQKRDAAHAPARKVTATISCEKPKPISPLVYGVSFGDAATVWELGASARRWGGNPTSRYNWKLGDAWNTGNDYFFRNVSIARLHGGWQPFLAEDGAHGVATAFTLPMLGWVAKDTTSCSFTQALYPDQKHFDPEVKSCGNGVTETGVPLPPPDQAQTSVPATPGFIGDWVQAVKSASKKDLPRLYFLDNEPTLWHVTHRDVHPGRLSYQELLDRTVQYGLAARAADPQARIAGFVAWGWSALYYSAEDKADGTSFLALDRVKHGNEPLLPWWLKQLNRYEQESGKRVVDLVDVHFYPQATGVGIYTDGWTDRESCLKRIRSTRALWDPTYKDESWINDSMMLIPRLRAWIDQSYPGLGISIGEYNFGAENHISGGLALAEALGQFGVNGLEQAFYWPLPPRGSAAYWGFRAFRNFDGEGGKVGDESLKVTLSEKGLFSIFATRRQDGALVVVALDHDPEKALELTVAHEGCGEGLEARRLFSYAGEEGLQPVALEGEARAGKAIRLNPWSINVLEMSQR